MKLKREFKTFLLDEILDNHEDIAYNILQKIKPFEYFKTPKSYKLLVENSINAVIEYDLPYIFNIELSNIQKLKQLTKYLCNSKPYELNLSKLSQKIGIDRKTLYQYIHYLSIGDLLNKIMPIQKSDSIFLKPSKLYLQNPNLTHTFCLNPDIGTIREQFFVNMLEVNHKINYSKIGDFLIDDRYTIEIGGAKKSFNQIKDIDNSFVVADDIETGFGNKIPLWLFGFLY